MKNKTVDILNSKSGKKFISENLYANMGALINTIIFVNFIFQQFYAL